LYNRFRLIIKGDNRIDTSYYREGNVQLFALMPGSYELVADVMNIDGVWSDKPVKLFVEITPPFWKTWWFITTVAVALMLIAAYIVWISVRRQKEIQNYTRRLAESELKSLRLYMNPHFLFNSLTSLQSFVLTHKTGEANNFITKFSKLIRSVMTYSIKGELKLKEEVDLLKAYLELESVRFSTAFEYEISCDHNIDTEETVIPSLIIQPFIENAIKHGVTGVTGRQCYIHVRFFMEKNNLYCTIADNGKGRKTVKMQDKIHISSGIKFTEERIKLLIKDHTLPVLTITDTSNDEEMPGTTVKVLVPVLNLTDL
jgi:LytS/YehU family sensor histidine kinase